MSRSHLITRLLALRPTKQQMDYLVEEHVEMLLKENKKLRDDIAALKPRGLARTGRWVTAQIITGALLAGVLGVSGVYGYRFVTSPAFQEGMGQGHADAVGAVGNATAGTR